jgi:hypothetical protein
MAFFRDVADRVWQFVSPRKTVQRREKPFKAPAIPARTILTKKMAVRSQTPNAESTAGSSPERQISRWQDRVQTPGSTGSVDAGFLPPSPPTSFGRIDYLGDTVMGDSWSPKVAGDWGSDADWDANESTMVLDDGQFMERNKKNDAAQEKSRREIQGQELRAAGWAEDAVFLFQKLGMRGFEPLLPDSWVNDFDALPTDLFTPNDNLAFIKSDTGRHFHGMDGKLSYNKTLLTYAIAQHALEKLFALGGFARDAVVTKAPIRTPEYHIGKAIKNYNRWAMKDAGVGRTYEDISIFEMTTNSIRTRATVAEQNMIVKLSKLQERWAEKFDSHDDNHSNDVDYVAAPEELPTLYGVIASFTVMAFVTYVAPSQPDSKASLRTVAIFDFGEPGYDVWNSLAIAIFIIHCRNRLKQLREFLPEPELAVQSDPDL